MKQKYGYRIFNYNPIFRFIAGYCSCPLTGSNEEANIQIYDPCYTIKTKKIGP